MCQVNSNPIIAQIGIVDVVGKYFVAHSGLFSVINAVMGIFVQFRRRLSMPTAPRRT